MMHARFHYLLLCLTFTNALSLSAQTSDKYLKRLPQPNSTLFFIKPMTFKVDGNLASFVPDFTFTYFPESRETQKVTLNFTIQSKEPVEMVDTLILAGHFGIKPSFLFLEQKKGKWQNRFTGEIPLETVFSLLEEQGEHFAAVQIGAQRVYVPYHKSWRKASEAISPILRSEIKR